MVGGTSLMISSQMHTLATITFFWVLAGASLNSMQAALTTIIADRFPEKERGTVSGFVGAGMTSGGTIGIVLAGYTASTLTLAYALFAVPIALACLAFVLLNPEPRVERAAPPRFKAGAFFKSFWVSPREHPDFAWAFFGRFAIYMGYQGIVTYLLYILQGYIGLGLDDANHMIAKLSTVTFVALVIAGLGSGLLSDAIGRRKPLVFIASLLMGLAVTVPMFVPTIPGMIWYAALMGVGYGAFMSVDMALMTQVLPKSLKGADARLDRQGPRHSLERHQRAADPEPDMVRVVVESLRQRLPVAVHLGDGVRVRRLVLRPAHQVRALKRTSRIRCHGSPEKPRSSLPPPRA